MELIGSILSSLRASAPLLAQVRLGDEVALDLSASGGSPFHYVLAGACRLVVEDQKIDVSAGDLVLLPRGAQHRLEVGQTTGATGILDFLQSRQLPVWSKDKGLETPLLIELGDPPVEAFLLSGLITFERPNANLLLPHLPEIMSFRNVDVSMQRWLLAASGFFADEQISCGPGYAAVASRVIELLLIVAFRSWLVETRHEGSWLRGLGDPLVSRALLAMHDEPGRRWHLASLAASAGCSRSRLAQRFRETVGETPFAYLTRLRMSLAAAYLVETRRSVADIAENLGYAGTYAFARAFREAQGETPSRYRRARHSAPALRELTTRD